MIENTHQLSVTKQRVKEFEDALKIIENELLKQQIQIAGIKSILETLNSEIQTYEKMH